MKRWISLMALLYPRSWREEFGDEFGVLLDDVKPSWRVFANVLGGAITMQMTDGMGWLKLAASMAVVGAIVAGGLSFAVAPRYVSSAVISVMPQPDPVRPASPQVLQKRTAERVAAMRTQLLSRSSLFEIINDPSLELYKAERRRTPLEDVIEQMRHDLRIQARPSTDGGPIAFSIAFSYPDQAKAQATVHALAATFAELDKNTNQNNADAYRDFWRDMSDFAHTKPAPPAPPGEIVTVLDAANTATEAAGPNRIVFLACGLAGGLLLGLLAALVRRWPHGAWQLGGFAVAGCVLAVVVSFIIPERYTSTAVMAIRPAMITEDPLASLPAVTPAAEFLRQMEPQMLSSQTLAGIIQDPRLNLYPEERARKPMDEVVRNMLADDLRVAVVNPADGTNGAISAFSISFSYSDKFKAQLAVEALMNAFDKSYVTKTMSNTSQNHTLRGIIAERKAGEVLDVVDMASLPFSPVKPNRVAIAVAGLIIGLLLGVVMLSLPRPRTPVLQA